MRVAIAFLCILSFGIAGEPDDSILSKLDAIVIPLIDFEDTSVEEAVDYLRVRSIELNKKSPPEARGVSIMIRKPRAKGNNDNQLEFLGNVASRRIEKLEARNITLTNALIEIGKKTRADVYLTDVGFVICPQGTEPFPNQKTQNGKVLRKLTPDPDSEKE